MDFRVEQTLVLVTTVIALLVKLVAKLVELVKAARQIRRQLTRLISG